MDPLLSSTEQYGNNNTIPIPFCDVHCNHRGVCLANGFYCLCEVGFYGAQCQDSIVHLNPIGWRVSQYFCATIFTLLFGLTIAVGVNIKMSKGGHAGMNKDFAFIGIIAYSIYEFLALIEYWVDPYGVYYRSPWWWIQLAGTGRTFFVFVFFFVSLCHQIEFTRVVKTTWRKEKMFEKSNPRYVSKITADDLIREAKRFSIIKIIFGISILVGLFMTIITIILKIIYHPISPTFTLFFGIYLVLCCLAFTIFFIIYTRRLISEIHSNDQNPIKIMAYKICFWCINTIVAIIVILVWSTIGLTPTGIVYREIYSCLSHAIGTIVICSAFMDRDFKFMLTRLFTREMWTRKSHSSSINNHNSQPELASHSSADAISTIVDEQGVIEASAIESSI